MTRRPMEFVIVSLPFHEFFWKINEMMQFVMNFHGKWGLLDVVKSENNGICVVLTRDQWHLVTTRDPKKLPL